PGANGSCNWTSTFPTAPGSTSTANTVTITVLDDVGNSGAVTSTTAYNVDNGSTPSLGTITVTNTTTSQSTNPVGASGGQNLVFTAAASTGNSVTSASITANPTSLGIGSCSGLPANNAQTITCTLAIASTARNTAARPAHTN